MQHFPTHHLESWTLKSSNTHSQEFATGNVIQVINFPGKLNRSGWNLVQKVPQKASKAKGGILSRLFWGFLASFFLVKEELG